MKKYLYISILAVMPLLLIPNMSQAVPVFSGSVNLNFAPGNSTTLDWAVYAAGAADSLSGSTSQFTYQYTIHGWAGYQGFIDYSVFTGLSWTPAPGANPFVGDPLNPGSGGGITSAGQTSSNPGILLTDTGVAGGFIGSATAVPGLSDPNAWITSWFTSSATPRNSFVNSRANLSSSGLSQATINVGAGFDGQQIMAPGVPEPETWALILALMGFSTWWVRRRQDEQPMETTITA